jgi:hypothetical protein
MLKDSYLFSRGLENQTINNSNEIFRLNIYSIGQLGIFPRQENIVALGDGWMSVSGREVANYSILIHLHKCFKRKILSA